MAVVDRPAGDVRSANLLALRPGLAWLAVLAPMPVFGQQGEPAAVVDDRARLLGDEEALDVGHRRHHLERSDDVQAVKLG